ncbi:hypothetical protein ACFX13_019594 [Malus domestica]
MHGVVLCGKSKRLRTSKWCIKLQRCSLVLRITFLRKNGDGAALKALEKYHDLKKKKKKSATKLEQHGKEGSYKIVFLSGGKRYDEVTFEESNDQKVLHSINSLQSFAQPHTVKVMHCNKFQARAKEPPSKQARKFTNIHCVP